MVIVEDSCIVDDGEHTVDRVDDELLLRLTCGAWIAREFCRPVPAGKFQLGDLVTTGQFLSNKSPIRPGRYKILRLQPGDGVASVIHEDGASPSITVKINTLRPAGIENKLDVTNACGESPLLSPNPYLEIPISMRYEDPCFPSNEKVMVKGCGHIDDGEYRVSFSFRLFGKDLIEMTNGAIAYRGYCHRLNAVAESQPQGAVDFAEGDRVFLFFSRTVDVGEYTIEKISKTERRAKLDCGEWVYLCYCTPVQSEHYAKVPASISQSIAECLVHDAKKAKLDAVVAFSKGEKIIVESPVVRKGVHKFHSANKASIMLNCRTWVHAEDCRPIPFFASGDQVEVQGSNYAKDGIHEVSHMTVCKEAVVLTCGALIIVTNCYTVDDLAKERFSQLDAVVCECGSGNNTISQVHSKWCQCHG